MQSGALWHVLLSASPSSYVVIFFQLPRYLSFKFQAFRIGEGARKTRGEDSVLLLGSTSDSPSGLRRGLDEYTRLWGTPLKHNVRITPDTMQYIANS